ncbi:hypothetical protein KCP69_22645 [Salmonella enterica subsp. enterica]|nr:hypothetical protein KCP69_22645 [Salmonella enterica subsp. enterica]
MAPASGWRGVDRYRTDDITTLGLRQTTFVWLPNTSVRYRGYGQTEFLPLVRWTC